MKAAAPLADTAVLAGMVPPQSIEAEMAILGSLMIDGTDEAFDFAMSLIDEGDFYRDANRKIFHAIGSLIVRREPVDVVTLKSELERTNELDAVGGIGYLLQLGEFLPTSANLGAHCRIVRDKAALRRLITVGNEIAAMAHQADRDAGAKIVNGKISEVTPRAAAENAERLVMAATAAITTVAEDAGLPPSERRDPVPVWSMFRDEFAAIDERGKQGGGLLGPSTGFDAIDRITQGCVPGEYHLTASRPSMGKTSMEVGIGINVAEKGGRVIYFSMEMPRKALMHRVLSYLSGVPLAYIRTGSAPDPTPVFPDRRRLLNEGERAALGHASKRIWGKHFIIDDSQDLTPSTMEAKARRLSRQMGGLDLIIVDHATLMNSDALGGRYMADNERYAGVSRGLQKLSRNMGVCVRALVQLNRDVEKLADKRPSLSHLRGSGAWEQDADIVAFLYRASYYERHEEGDRTRADADGITRSEAEFLVEKHRNGETAYCKIAFAEEITRFENLRHSTAPGQDGSMF